MASVTVTLTAVQYDWASTSSRIYWYPAVADQVSIGAQLHDGQEDIYVGYLSMPRLSGDNFRIYLSTGNTVNLTGPDFTTQMEENGTITVTAEGGETATIDFGDDTSEPYSWTLSGTELSAMQAVGDAIFADLQNAPPYPSVTLTLNDNGDPPAAPAAPTFTSVMNTGFTANWVAPTSGTDITGYDLRYRVGSTGDWNTPGAITDLSATTLSYTFPGLEASTAYQVQVRASNTHGDGAWSPSGSVTTLAADVELTGTTSAGTATTAGELTVTSVVEFVGTTDAGTATTAGEVILDDIAYEGMQILIDWDRTGEYSHAYSNVSADIIGREFSAFRGRNFTSRVISRPVSGTMRFRLRNNTGTYTLTNPASPLFGINPEGVSVKLRLLGTDIWTGLLDDVRQHTVRSGDDYAAFSCYGMLSQMRQRRTIAQQADITTGAAAQLLYGAITGESNQLLRGDKIMSRWWLDDRDVLQALYDLEEAEEGILYENGAGKIAMLPEKYAQTEGYADPIFTLTSLTPLTNEIPLARLVEREESKAISNIVQVPVYAYGASAETVLWYPGQDLILPAMDSLTVIVQYPNARTPRQDIAVSEWTPLESDVDYTAQTGLTVSSETIEEALHITLTNSSALPMIVSDLQVRGQPLSQLDPVLVERQDADSITEFGRRVYPDASTWMRDTALGIEYADSVLFRHRRPLRIAEATWDAHYGLGLTQYDIGQRVTLKTSTGTGLYTIHGITHYLSQGTRHDIMYTLLGLPDPVVPRIGELKLIAVSTTSMRGYWDAPFDGGSPILGYDVRLRVVGATDWTTYPVGGAVLQYVEGGLTVGTQYEWQVRALNAVGAGPWSAGVVGSTEAEEPAAPTNLSVSGLAAQTLVLSWDSPFDGGADIESYSVQIRQTGIGADWEACTQAVFIDATDTTATVQYLEDGTTRLPNGTTYEFRVAATNSVGTGDWSSPAQGTTIVVVPGIPVVTIVSTDPDGIQADWVEPDTGGAPILEYGFDYRLSSVTDWTTISTSLLTTTFTGVADMEYTYRIRARNSAGWGNYSVLATFDTGGIPAAPASVTAVVSGQTATVSATAGDGSPPTSFEYAYKLTSSSSWLSMTGNTVSGLVYTSTYHFRARGVNSYGNGPWATSINYTVPATAPDAPVVSVTLTSIHTQISWTTPDNNGSAIIRYQVNATYPSDTYVYYFNVPTNNYTQLTGHASRVSVRAENTQGWGPYGSWEA